MANTFKFGNGEWARKTGQVLAYNSENDNYKPLPFTFDRASSATRVNKQGLIETVATDEPRIDFLNNTKGHLLLEPQRTNNVLYSETEGIILGSNGWSGNSDTVITNNYGTAPYNGSNLKSTRLQFAGASKEFRNAFTNVNIQACASVWIKGTQGETIKFGTNANEAIFTLNGDWQKISQISTQAIDCSKITFNTFSGATARDIEIYAPQVEAGSYATSYIPTSGSAVTRSAETCKQENLPSASIPSAYPFTVFCDFQIIEDIKGYGFSFLNIASSSEYFSLIYRADDVNNFRFTNRISSIYNAETTSTYGSGFYKIAVVFSQTNIKAYINGSEAVNYDHPSASLFSNVNDVLLGQLRVVSDIGSRNNVKDLRFYNTALSDSELQALTS